MINIFKKSLNFKTDFLNINYLEDRISVKRQLVGIFLFSLLIRIPLILFPEVIHNDGTVYISHAKRILSGDWSIGSGLTHPFYPLLIALAHYIFPNGELAGIGVSVFLGSLLIIPLFYLASTLFNKKVGFYSVFFASVHPFLYIYSGSVLTESTFYFLLVSSVLFGWKAFEKGRFQDILSFSLFVSLSYLTRIEGIGFLILFVLWVLFVSPPIGERSWVKRVSIALIAISIFLIFSSPYLIQIKKETGNWQISKKISISLGSLSEEDEESIIKIRENKSIRISSFIQSPLIFMKLIVLRGIESLYKFFQVYTPYLFIIALIGIFMGKSEISSLKRNFFILSFSLYLLCFVHPLFRPGRRYATHVIPIALPWAAFGFLQIVEEIKKAVKKEKLQTKIFILFLIITLVSLFIQGRIMHRREHRIIQKEVGLWIKEHLPKGSKLMSRLPQEAFYGELEWIKIPSKDLEEVIKEAYSKKVQYLVIDHEVIKQSPKFLEKVRNCKELELLNHFERNSRWIKVFRIRNHK